MAFMMPVVKNDYNIYASRPISRSGMGTPVACTPSQSSRGSSLSSSPTGVSFTSSPRSSQTPAFPNTPKNGSQVSLHKFHTKLLDKLRKTFRGKDESDDSQASTSSTAMIS